MDGYLFKERTLSTVISQLSEQNQLSLCSTVVLLARSVFHSQRDVIWLEVMYVEDCFENRKPVAVVYVCRVHWAFDALGTLLFCRLHNQKVAHLLKVFLQTISATFC